MNFFRAFNKNLLKAGLTFFDNSLVYLLNKRPYRSPLFVGWDITSTCNAKCVYCDRWKKENQTKNLTLEEKLIIVKELARAKVWMISIGGGEPLIESDLEIVLKELKKSDIFTNILTNGSLLKEKGDMLIDSEVNNIIISVDSSYPKLHDSVRNYVGLFKKINEGVEYIKNNRKGRKPYLIVRMLLNKRNFFDLDDYLHYWKNKVDDVLLQPIHHSKKLYLKHHQR